MEKDFAYDALPYSNAVFTQTHPNRLASLAAIFGLKSPAVEKARILELGCGNGMNLISQAFVLPEAEFVGIDLAKTHIEYAENSVRELNLSNIKFRQYDLMEMSAEDFGKFDYIIAHGLISWIPEIVRQKVFSIYREMLTANGVGFISYNTYPGWHYRQILRGIGRIHTRGIDAPLEKVESATEFAKFLGANLPKNDVYKFIIQDGINSFADVGATSIFHDTLADVNNPFYFHEFAALLEENGLQFLSEAELFSMSTQNIAPEAKTFIENIEDVIWRGQYLDFFTGRMFRQTLFCQKEIDLNHNPPSSVLDDIYIASTVKAVSENPELHTEKVEKFIGLEGRGIEINHPLTKAALFYSSEILNNPVSLTEILSNAKEILEKRGFAAENWEEHFQAVRNILLHLVLHTDFIQLFTSQPKIYTKINEKPEINVLARWQLNKGDCVSAGYDKIFNTEDSLTKHLLELLDGTRTREALYEELRMFVEANGEIEDKEIVLKDLADNLSEYLQTFAQAGLFVP